MLNLIKSLIIGQILLYAAGILHFLWTINYYLKHGIWIPSVGLGLLLADLLFIISCREKFSTYNRYHLRNANIKTITNIELELKDLRSTKCAKSFLQGWMFDTPIEQISRLDLKEWISGMLLHKHLNEIDYKSHLMIDGFIKMPLKSTGTSPKINLYCDEMQIMFRPIVYYTVCGMLGWITRSELYCSGFQYENLGGIAAFAKFGTSQDRPIILFHGFGIGLLPYMSFINGLITKYPNRTIILFELKCLAMRLNLEFLLPEDYSQKVGNYLEKQRITEVTAIGHSFGTACICWLDNHYPNLVKNRIYIDPICFALWTPDIARNFMYRKSTNFKL